MVYNSLGLWKIINKDWRLIEKLINELMEKINKNRLVEKSNNRFTKKIDKSKDGLIQSFNDLCNKYKFWMRAQQTNTAV